MSALLVDGNNLYYRSWFANQRNEMSAEGTPTGCLVIFMATMSSMIRSLQPTKIGVCWDGGKSAYRTQVRASYKANRDHSDYSDAVYGGRVLVQTALALCGIPQISRQGYEADDLIAGFWYGAEDPVTIVSNDKDLLQLAGPNPQGHDTRVIRVSTGDVVTDAWGPDEVLKHYGCSPAQLALLMALMGDKADNIEGIPGIGPKRALKILNESNHNTIGVLNHPKVVDHAQLVRSNLMLISLRMPIAGMDLRPIKPFDPVQPGHQDWEHLEKFLNQYQLKQIKTKITEDRYWSQPQNTFGG